VGRRPGSVARPGVP